MENTSGRGKESVVPEEVRGWNWGAFLLNAFWGIGNNTYRALLMFVPLVNFFVAIALGLKGSEWAWRHKKWDSVEHFKKVQRRWAIAGGIFVALSIAMGFATFFVVTSIFKNTEVYKLSLEEVVQTQLFSENVGTPYEAGSITGNIHVSSDGSSGQANIAYKVEGPKGNGQVQTKAIKDLDGWQLHCLKVRYEKADIVDSLIPCK